MKFVRVGVAGMLGLFVGCMSMNMAHARGVSPYLPLHMSPEIERQIERLMVLAGRPVMKRPIPAAEVLDALPAACQVDPVLCKAVRRYLDVYMDKYAVTHLSAEAAAARESTKTLPNSRGMSAGDSWAVSAQGFFQISNYVLLQAGGLAYPGKASATGSWLSLGNEYAQLDVGLRDHWWSPMTDSGMLISTQAPTMPGFTLSNYQPISRFGFRYELYAARMSHTDDILYQGERISGYPEIGGVLLSIEPTPGWALSVSRLLQYGGGPRPSSFRDFLDAFFKPTQYDTVSSPDQDQFGNQVAAITSRFVFPARRPFSVYFEYAGEDGSRGEGWRLGNVSLSAGLDIPKLWNRFDLTYEISDWQNGWYVNTVYPEGTSNDGHVIGHWGADDRVLRDAVGAQSHSLRLGWTPSFGGVLEVRYRTLANDDYSVNDYVREHEIALRYSRARGNLVFGGELQAGRDVFGDDFARIGAFARFVPGLPSYESSAISLVNDDSNNSKTQVFVDAGINASRLKYDPYDNGVTPKRDVSTIGPHIGVGARRAVSESTDLGVRLEFDMVDGTSMISVRAIDYRHRFGDKLAMSVFGGATRYEGGTAAYGYYGGVGAQLRDVLPRIDLNLDLRGTDKVARDLVLPSDPTNSWGDVLYVIYSANLYLSYRFQ